MGNPATIRVYYKEELDRDTAAIREELPSRILSDVDGVETVSVEDAFPSGVGAAEAVLSVEFDEGEGDSSYFASVIHQELNDLLHKSLLA